MNNTENDNTLKQAPDREKVNKCKKYKVMRPWSCNIKN